MSYAIYQISKLLRTITIISEGHNFVITSSHIPIKYIIYNIEATVKDITKHTADIIRLDIDWMCMLRTIHHLRRQK